MIQTTNFVDSKTKTAAQTTRNLQTLDPLGKNSFFSPTNSTGSSRFAKIMNAMERQDQMSQQRQFKILQDIEKEEKAQKKRDMANKERRKERLESSLKKDTALKTARDSVSQRISQINSKAVKDYKSHLEDLRGRKQVKDEQSR